jgi:single-strand DNA-binding protein
MPQHYEDTNIVILTGNLTRDPDYTADSGTPVANIRLGVNGRRKKNDEWVDKPNFINVVCFGKDAENARKYLGKGRPIQVVGRLDWSEWGEDEDRKESVKVIAQRIRYMGAPKGSEQAASAEAASGETEAGTEELAGVGAGSDGQDIPL